MAAVTRDAEIGLRFTETLASRGFVVERHDTISALMEPQASTRLCLVIDAAALAAASPLEQESIQKSKSELPLFVLTDPLQVDGVTQLIADRFESENGEEVEKRYQALTKREREVMGCIASGMTNKQASRELGVSPRTVEVHRSRVMHKMGARSLSDLVRMAVSLNV